MNAVMGEINVYTSICSPSSVCPSVRITMLIDINIKKTQYIKLNSIGFNSALTLYITYDNTKVNNNKDAV